MQREGLCLKQRDACLLIEEMKGKILFMNSSARDFVELLYYGFDLSYEVNILVYRRKRNKKLKKNPLSEMT